MKIDLETLVRIAWVVVAIAAAAPLVLSRVKSDLALLQFLRSRSHTILPIDRVQLGDEIGAGIRVALFLTIPLVLYGAFGIPGNAGWWLAIILAGAVLVPMVTIPISIAHAVLLRCLAFRGLLVSVAAGFVVGTIAARIIRDGDYAKPLIIYGAAYGLIIALGRTRIVPRSVTEPPEEAAKRLS